MKTLSLRSFLILSALLISSFCSYGQEDFRLKPWKAYSENGANSFNFSLDGKLIQAPQYINKTSFKSCVFQIYDNKNVQISGKNGQHFQDEIDLITKNLKQIVDPNWKHKEEVKKALECIGLSFANYKATVNEILAGTAPTIAEYKKFFPEKLHEFIKNDPVSEDPIAVKMTWYEDSSDPDCNCDNSRAVKSYDLKICDNTFAFNELKSGRYSFEIVYENKPYKILKNWKDNIKTFLSQTIQSNSANDIQVLQNQKKIGVGPDSKDIKIPNSEFLLQEDFLETDSTYVKNLLTNVDEMMEMYSCYETIWRLSAFWFSGEMSHDPFKRKVDLENNDKKLAELEDEIEGFQKFHEDCCGDLEYEEYSQERRKLFLQKRELLESNEKAKKELKKFKSSYASFFNDSTTLYKGLFYLSGMDENSTFFMRNHDGNNGYSLMGMHRVEYYQNEKVKYIAHNTTEKNAKRIKLSLDTKKIESPNPGWVNEVNDVFDTASSLTELSEVQSAKDEINATIRPYLLESQRRRQNGFLGQYVGVVTTGNTWNMDSEMEKRIDTAAAKLLFLESFLSLDWIDELLPKLEEKNRILGESHELKPSNEQYKKPSEVSYSFKTFKEDNSDDKTYDFSQSFKYFKWKYVQLFAGFNYNPLGAETISIEDSTGTAIPKVETNFVQFNVGVKIYPAGGEVHDKRFVVGSKHRFFLSAAFSLPKPLNNMYAGVGWDLIPGISVHGNLHMFRDFDYNISNGQIISQKVIYRPSVSVGLGIDVSVFTKAIKFFF